MSKIVIGIHGLGNKPTKALLEKWWKRSILEGLRSVDRTRLSFVFELVYWADILNAEPLDPSIKSKEDPLYLDEPYTPGKMIAPVKESGLQSKILSYTERQLDKIFLNDDMSLNFSSITDRIIRQYFGCLEAYYSKSILVDGRGKIPAKDLIREKLSSVLRRHDGKDILLIGHSMGSIIAYDVLTQSVPDIQIDTFITIGSPLGLPMVVSKIFSEQRGEKTDIKNVRTPDNIVKYWYNFSDIEDKVALDHTLNDDYEGNIHNVRAADKLVFNDYVIKGERNPHKSFGYLRTPEMSAVIDQFLEGKFSFVPKSLQYKINRWLYDYKYKIREKWK
ncbi:hypothetical protein ACFL2O_05175 [Thermodesulfobacteriota bacterium]